MCNQLLGLGISFYRNPNSNIITIKAEFVDADTAKLFDLVPDNHRTPAWYKVVIMEHVTIEKLSLLLEHVQQPEPLVVH